MPTATSASRSRTGRRASGSTSPKSRTSKPKPKSKKKRAIWELDKQYQLTNVIDVKVSGDGWQLEMDSGGLLWVEHSDVEPTTGRARIYGAIGSPVRGLVINRRVIFYRTKGVERARLEVLGPILVLSGLDALYPNRVNQMVQRWMQGSRPWLQDRARALLESPEAASKPEAVRSLWRIIAGFPDVDGDVPAGIM